MIAAAIERHQSPVQVRQTLALAYLEADDPKQARAVLDETTQDELVPIIELGMNY
jgi:hypothetical protein